MDSQNETPKPKPRGRPRKTTPERVIEIYAVQCKNCEKWRKTDTIEQYEDIRSRIKKDPYVCEKIGKSCEDPADLNYDDCTLRSVIDKPSLPKTPTGFTRSLILRKDESKVDAYYIPECGTGKKLKTLNDFSAFINTHQDYKDLSIKDFNFTVPRMNNGTKASKKNR